MPSTMRTSRGVLARQVLDERHVVVHLVRAHGPVVGEVVARLPAAEERQVVGEPHLRHAELDGALDVLSRLSLGVRTHAGVDVVVGDHERPQRVLTPCPQAYTCAGACGAAPRAPPRRRANRSTSPPVTKPADVREERHAPRRVPNDRAPPTRCSPNQTASRTQAGTENTGKMNDHDHGEHPGAREEHEIGAEHAGDRAAGADQRHRRAWRRRAPAPPWPPCRRRGRSRGTAPRPMASSTLLPKIHRYSMLTSRCSQPPCTNIAVNSVAHHGTRSAGGTSTPLGNSKGRAPSGRSSPRA